ncbi:MAG: hypothetical protein GY847_26345 [Proteobacteria bacterium]|nr:hypothetical protein [Pseudomonadota bacterium]
MKTNTLRILLSAFVVIAACSTDEKKKETAAEQPELSPKTPAREPAAKVSRRLLLFGLDGATWVLMDPLLEQGKLPNFKKLIDRGVRAPLKTFKPTSSPLIWTSIATGMLPEMHGITDFTFKIPGTQESSLPTSNMRRVPALWNILSDSDFGVGVIGWWATYPAEKVKGFVISDQASTLRTENYEVALKVTNKAVPHVEQAETHPPELNKEIKEAIESSPDVGLQHLSRFMKLPPKKLAWLKAANKVDIEDIFSVFSVALLIDQAFVVSAIHSIDKFKPEVAAFYLAGLDHAAEHNFWKFIEPEKFKDISKSDIKRYGKVIDEYYIYMDEVLGSLLALYPEKDSTIIVVSDHGHEANKNYDPKSQDHYDRVCSGDHKEAPDGILIFSGKDIEPGAKLSKATVLDIVPTVLALMGVAVAEDMPGRVLKETIKSEFLKSNPVTSVKTYSKGKAYSNTPVPSKMSNALKEKLKGLGYIE